MTLIDDVVFAVDGFHRLERRNVSGEVRELIVGSGARKCAHGGDGVRVD